MLQPDGLYWIYSDSDKQYGGLRLATFLMEAGGVQYVIIHNEESDRVGIRDWDLVRRTEGFFKVKHVQMPTREDIDCARTLGSPIDAQVYGQ